MAAQVDSPPPLGDNRNNGERNDCRHRPEADPSNGKDCGKSHREDAHHSHVGRERATDVLKDGPDRA